MGLGTTFLIFLLYNHEYALAVYIIRHTSEFRHNTELCHLQRFLDDIAILWCVRNGQEEECREPVKDFDSCR